MQRYLSERASLIASGDPGPASARSLAALTDDVLARLADGSRTRPPGRWALIALGGYGAGALLPSSDVDLLLLSEGSASELKPFVESLLYPLWDAGMAVGHQVRSPKVHLAAARKDAVILTSSMTGRVIAGDAEYGDSLLVRCATDAHKRERKTLALLACRERPGSPYLLEPDLKEGAGGRRDFDELVWSAAVVSGCVQTTPAALVDAGHLESPERDLLEAAAAVVATARWKLSQLGLGQQLTLDAASTAGVEAQAVQQALADTAHCLQRVRRRMSGSRSAPVELSDASASPLVAREVFDLLHQSGDDVGDLEEAAWLGRLDGLLPGFRALLPLRRPGLTHTLTVGAHSIRCARLAAEMPAHERSVLSRSLTAIADDRPLLVAALAHDSGKSRPGPGHAERGALSAAETAWLFGLGEQQQADVADLVRLHLVLAESAMHDDLDSEDVVLGVAEKIRRRELVAPLHVLTVADTLATGPSAWGAWQETLVGKLVSRVDAALSPDVDGAGLARAAEDVRCDALSALPADAPGAALEFVNRASIRYLASRDAAQVALHARLAAEYESTASSSPMRLAVRPGPVPGTFEAAIVARDRPELFARVSGALTLAGLDILSADAYNAAPGVVLDVFTVRSATLASIEHETWQRAERYLEAALSDRLQLDTRLAERKRHYSSSRKRMDPKVTIDTSAGYDTAVLVTATDRVGLLYDIAGAIASEGLDIRWAKVLTNGEVARDTFHVVGPDGQAPTDSGQLGHVAMRIRERA